MKANRSCQVLHEELARARAESGLFGPGGRPVHEMPRCRCAPGPSALSEADRALYSRYLAVLDTAFRRAHDRLHGDGDGTAIPAAPQ